jgi:hypothetical protein
MTNGGKSGCDKTSHLIRRNLLALPPYLTSLPTGFTYFLLSQVPLVDQGEEPENLDSAVLLAGFAMRWRHRPIYPWYV